MGLVIGIVMGIATTFWLGFIAFAASMSDSPTEADNVSFWPSAVIGYGLTGLLVASHYLNFGW